jgi:AraC-like DNA-binding protein
VADILCIEDASDDVEPRIHGRFSVTIMRSAAVVRCESSRSLGAARNCVLLVPASQLYSLRAQSRPTGATVTLLVGASHLKGLEVTDRAALVTDVALVEQVEALVAQLSLPVVPLESAAAMRAVLGRLIASAAPVGSLLPRQGTPLGAARDYLRAHSTEPVTIGELADMMGLAESHLIRAFHREFGLPPHAYQMRLRLAAASELLSRGLSVSTVAFECGFADQSHLSRNFRTVYGLTPAAWVSAVAARARRRARPGAMRSLAPAPTRDRRVARMMDV